METLIGNPATFVSELVWTVINFFLLFFLLKRFLFTPVIRFTEERKSRMDAKLAVEQDAKARASENDEKLAAEKEKAREEARCILSEAEESREKHHAAAVAEMKANAAKLRKDGEADLTDRREKTAERLRDATPELAELLTRRLLREE